MLFSHFSLIVEEASHLFDIETFIPSALQVPTVSSDGIALPAMDESLRDRLKRVVLVGDNHQPPQTLHNQSLAEQTTRFEESFFSRLIRLQYPVTYLDQVYTKPEVVSYFSWRYEQPTHKVVVSPVIQTAKDYVNGNAGFYYSSQWIDVPLFQNQGEVAIHSSYQNLGEAEYVVATFQYMCLLGYPADRISIVTTYEAQRKLIKQLLYQRCQLDHDGAGNVFSKPRHISTVDSFQSLRNDFILVSLVRTQAIQPGDLKLALSAFSRARLGLYVFGHLPLFKQHQAWFPLLAQALGYPTKLTLVAGESFPTERVQSKMSHLDDTSDVKSKILEIEDVTTIGILVYQMVQQMQHMKSQ